MVVLHPTEPLQTPFFVRSTLLALMEDNRYSIHWLKAGNMFTWSEILDVMVIFSNAINDDDVEKSDPNFCRAIFELLCDCRFIINAPLRTCA